MLRISGHATRRFCDGVSRRNFLQIGALTLGSLSLAELLRAEAAAGVSGSTKSIINIHLPGGPSHQDTFDLKPDAPREFRGEFNPIHTNVPGFDICEHFPKLATRADQFAVIRSVVGMVDDHSNFHTHTGFSRRDLQNVGGRPAVGSVASKLLGPSAGGAPPFISYNGGEPGFLGPTYKPYEPSGSSLRLNGALSADRLASRTKLLSDLDSLRRDADRSGQMKAMDSFTQRAVDVVVSGRVADAVDLNKEKADIVRRYGNDGKMFLTARRLVEAGVRVVTFNWGGWDTHGNNFGQLRQQLPKLDNAMSCLLQDLKDRSLDKDVLIVMWGEFGRTPRVNSGAGRDHWSRVAMSFMAGGGLRMGQAIGATTRNAEEAAERPVHLREIVATLYHHLGINAAQTTINDPNGRPQYLVDGRKPIAELI